MIVAVILVRSVEPTLDEIIDVIVVRHGLVAAAFAVRVGGIAGDRGCMATRMRLIHCDHVFIDVIFMRMMQMTVVQVVDVVIMAHRGVAAVRSVRVSVCALMGLMSHTADTTPPDPPAQGAARHGG